MARPTAPKIGTELPVTRTHRRSFVFVRDQVLEAGTTVIVTGYHKDWRGLVTHLTVRHPTSGEFFEKVPLDAFRTR